MLTGSTGRRAFLRSVGGLAAAVPLLPAGAGSAVARSTVAPGLPVRPRRDWAQGLDPTGPLTAERREDVRFLLVHHTASPNRYVRADVPGLIRGFHRLHTSPEKGWPDVAYNFFVDRFGQLWEGRAGSLDGPVAPDATGGSQGFAQLCCFIGDHRTEEPTPESVAAMTGLLAALADAYAVDTTPGARITFVSRGSNRWPRGAAVTASGIAGHRDMSLTTCPGDAAYRLVRDVLPAAVTAARAAAAPPSAPSPSTAPPVLPPVAASVPPAGSGSGEDLAGSPGVLTGAGLLVSGAAVLAAFALRRRGRPR